ncbi:hypothetical protein RRG08_059821 [Elysia crispata]|uniref:Uncharacterized protein n=1 Tax=Elysia crispata TaxID=231223 RepID=A0AAE1BD60_9GAST|nr:hypothetical protein RRG08_059821 [Elysia crispata]
MRSFVRSKGMGRMCLSCHLKNWLYSRSHGRQRVFSVVLHLQSSRLKRKALKEKDLAQSGRYDTSIRYLLLGIYDINYISHFFSSEAICWLERSNHWISSILQFKTMAPLSSHQRNNSLDQGDLASSQIGISGSSLQCALNRISKHPKRDKGAKVNLWLSPSESVNMRAAANLKSLSKASEDFPARACEIFNKELKAELHNLPRDEILPRNTNRATRVTFIDVWKIRKVCFYVVVFLLFPNEWRHVDLSSGSALQGVVSQRLSSSGAQQQLGQPGTGTQAWHGCTIILLSGWR